MTRKDYEVIAAAIRKAHMQYSIERPKEYRKGSQDMHDYMRNHIVNALAADNPRFSRERFMTACNMRPDHEKQ